MVVASTPTCSSAQTALPAPSLSLPGSSTGGPRCGDSPSAPTPFQEVDRPLIVLWDETPGNGFPGYGWLFPGEGGSVNVGLGLGLRADRSTASRAVRQLDAFC